jgi:hypothetical protein
MKSLPVVVFIFASALGVYGQESGQAIQRVKGTVLSSGNVSFAIETIGGRRMAFMVLADTAMPRAKIYAGDSVTVSYRQLDAERLGATAVTTSELGTHVAAKSPGGVATEEGEGWRTQPLVRLVAMGLLVGSGVMTLVALARAHGRRHGTV